MELGVIRLLKGILITRRMIFSLLNYLNHYLPYIPLAYVSLRLCEKRILFLTDYDLSACQILNL